MTAPKDQPRQADRMTGRERILAALNKETVDRIPFVPLIGPYTLMDMPEEVAGKATGWGLFDPPRMIAASRALGCDLMIRHVAATGPFGTGAPHLQSLGGFAPLIEVKTEFKDGQLSETLTTPVGSVTGRWKFTDRVGVIPHLVKYVVNNYEEMNIFHYAVEHMNTEPVAANYDAFLEIDKMIGDEGIPTASISNSPLMFLIEMAWGLESTYLLLHDHRDEVEDILDKLHASLKRYVEVLAASPAQVVIQYENTSTTLLSPTIFRRYCLPYLNDYADILKRAGKIHLIHMCGTLHSLVDDIAQGHFNGICDVAPPPTGDLPLDEAAAKLPGKVVIGGIDANTFICRDAELVKAEVSNLIQHIKPFRGVLLGSGDVTPRGTPVENLRTIRSLVDTIGAYT
jgi:uroporphyrinogen-III decarboxylase